MLESSFIYFMFLGKCLKDFLFPPTPTWYNNFLCFSIGQFSAPKGKVLHCEFFQQWNANMDSTNNIIKDGGENSFYK